MMYFARDASTRAYCIFRVREMKVHDDDAGEHEWRPHFPSTTHARRCPRPDSRILQHATECSVMGPNGGADHTARTCKRWRRPGMISNRGLDVGRPGPCAAGNQSDAAAGGTVGPRFWPAFFQSAHRTRFHRRRCCAQPPPPALLLLLTPLSARRCLLLPSTPTPRCSRPRSSTSPARQGEPSSTQRTTLTRLHGRP